MRLERGHWESKDEKGDIEAEIRSKFDKGYPNQNILFEDSQNAVLYQNGREVMRCRIAVPEELDSALNAFVRFEPPEVQDFRKAIELFSRDIPSITQAISERTKSAKIDNPIFVKQCAIFLELCQRSIKPAI